MSIWESEKLLELGRVAVGQLQKEENTQKAKHIVESIHPHSKRIHRLKEEE